MPNKKIQKTFIPGDAWLYYKIYCGVKTADTLLIGEIKEITEKLVQEQLIDKWFFIRYSDPEPHLRIRLHIPNLKNFSDIVLKIKTLFLPFIETRQIWDIQIASYQREVERYGSTTIIDAESFFFYDSKQVLQIIENTADDEARFLMVFRWLENMVDLFKFKNERRMLLLEKMQLIFKEEFNATKTIKKELSSTYRHILPKLTEKNNPFCIVNNSLQPIVARFLMLEKEQKLTVSLESLLTSMIHMTVNRTFRSKQRLYEMMLYDFLFRKNKTNFARYGKT